jgi:putative ABC transport system permease protein
VIDKPFSKISSLTDNLSNGLNQQDLELINSIVNKYGYSSMTLKLKNQSIYFDNGDTTCLTIGTNNKFHLIEQLAILKGRALLKYDLKNFSRVAVISKDIAYKHSININNNIIFKNTIYKVVGIIETKDNLNNFILVPYNVINLKKITYNEINIFIKDKKDIFVLANRIKNRLLQQHKNLENFLVNIPLKIIKKEEQTQNIFNTVLLSIAIMSLLTGGISVMNAVLSNINEQTREIGLKLALGATQLRIMRFYLLYTTLLTVIGGVLGGIFAYLILLFLTIFSNLYIIFSLKAFLLGIIMSIISGIIFGIYPAMRASKIEPIIALKEF